MKNRNSRWTKRAIVKNSSSDAHPQVRKQTEQERWEEAIADQTREYNRGLM